VREYEFIYIIQPDATPEREKEIQARVEKEIVAGGGQILLWDDWGKRKLAYEIRKFNKGHYMLVSFLGGGRFIPEIERFLRLDPDVLRFLAVKVDDNVRDIEARLVRAKEDEAERARKREERERREAERAARAEAEGRVGESDEVEDEEPETRAPRAEDAAPEADVSDAPAADTGDVPEAGTGDEPEADASDEKGEG
jgi:small subunit ribosomal protein S6